VSTHHDPTNRAASAALNNRRRIMGKYVLGWFLGVPVVVLVVIYLIFH
jgi:type VI protein secretion system component VasF